jgi:dipeptidyl aminopeptidase/acylaminoacyl peptidase
MRHSVIAVAAATAALLVACSARTPESRKVTGPSATYTMDQFLKTTSIGGSSFSPDETHLLVSSNESGVFNVYELDLASGTRTPVTQGDQTTFAVAYLPPDGRILYSRDSGGNEIDHLYLRALDGSDRDLTSGDQTKEDFAGFSTDRKSFYTVNNSRDPRFFDLYEWDVATLEPHMVYRNDAGLDPAGMSPDRRFIALQKSNTTNDTDLYVLDLTRSGEPKRISEHSGEATFGFQDFSSDSRWLYYTSNADGEFAALKRYELATGTREDVLSTDWDIDFAYFSRNGTYRVIGTNEDGYTKVAVTRTADGQPIQILDLPRGTVSGVAFSPSERLMKLSVSSDTMPGNMFLYDLENQKLTQLTDTLNPEIKPSDLVAGEVARFTARDGMVIPGPLYKPLGAGPDHKVPVMLMIHGGPGGQSRPGYSAERQFLLNHGYALFAVNNRGSSGYGKTFLAADDGKHGREPLWDCVDAKEWLKTQDWVDPERIGIMGGSYGGYMTLAALAFQPDQFAVGVDLFGVANWIRTLESIPPYWESFRLALYKEIGDPEKEHDFLYDTSPVFHADKITKPLLILQGENDPRVLKAESDDMVAAIRDHGGVVEYVVFDDEGHGFTKNANRIRGWEAVLRFLDTHLKGQPVAPVTS